MKVSVIHSTKSGLNSANFQGQRTGIGEIKAKILTAIILHV